MIDLPAWIYILSYVNNKSSYVQRIANDLNITYSHTLKVINALRWKELLEVEKKGRLSIIKITDKGRGVARAINQIREVADVK